MDFMKLEYNKEATFLEFFVFLMMENWSYWPMDLKKNSKDSKI